MKVCVVYVNVHAEHVKLFIHPLLRWILTREQSIFPCCLETFSKTLTFRPVLVYIDPGYTKGVLCQGHLFGAPPPGVTLVEGTFLEAPF